MSGWWSDFKSWLAAPLQAEMNPLHIFYVTGLYVVFVVIWIFLLGHIIRVLQGK